MITIEELLGRKAAGLDKSEDYIAWAVEQLIAGSGSENVAILAGLDLGRPVDSEEVLRYFLACVRERGTEIPPDDAALRTFAEILCKKIANDELDPREGLSQLARLYAFTDYSEELYAIWDQLEDDVSALAFEHIPIFNSALTNTNIDDFIRAVAAQFLALIRTPLPANFFRLTHCAACGFVGEPRARPLDGRWIPESVYHLVFRRGRTFEQRCRNCGRRRLLQMYDYEGRQRFLQARTGEGT